MKFSADSGRVPKKVRRIGIARQPRERFFSSLNFRIHWLRFVKPRSAIEWAAINVGRCASMWAASIETRCFFVKEARWLNRDCSSIRAVVSDGLVIEERTAAAQPAAIARIRSAQVDQMRHYPDW
jgi:hypothetical protein